MVPHRVIGFKAIANAGYDCSFMVMFPLHSPVTPDQVQQACQNAANEANRMHGGMTIKGQAEKIIMTN